MVHPFISLSPKKPVVYVTLPKSNQQSEKSLGTNSSPVSQSERVIRSTSQQPWTTSSRMFSKITLPFKMGCVVSRFRHSQLRERSTTDWLEGESLDIHSAIEAFDNYALKKCLKSDSVDPSINCCKLYTTDCIHLASVAKELPDILENVAPLHLAVIVDNLEAVKTLLLPDMRTPACVNQRIKGCQSTALHLAVLLERKSMIPELMRAGADLVRLKDDNGFTPFELAVHRNSSMTKDLYNEFYAHKSYNQVSFLYEYLTTEVREDTILELLSLGENTNYAPKSGDTPFIKLLREYKHKNAVQVISFFLGHLCLEEEETKLLSVRRGEEFKQVPTLSNAHQAHRLDRCRFNNRKGYNTLAIVIMYCPRPSTERIQILQMLIAHGTSIHHKTLKERSLLHLCTKSRLSCIEEAVFLIKQGLQVTWTDVRQAIKYSRLDFLEIFLRYSTVSELGLSKTFPYAMSMMTFKSVPDRMMASHLLTRRELQDLFISFFQMFIDEHGLNPFEEATKISGSGEFAKEYFYPLPLIYLLILKNDVYPGFYEPIIKYILQKPSTSYLSIPSHGSPYQYASALKQFKVVQMILDYKPDWVGSSPTGRRLSSASLLSDNFDDLAAFGVYSYRQKKTYYRGRADHGVKQQPKQSSIRKVSKPKMILVDRPCALKQAFSSWNFGEFEPRRNLCCINEGVPAFKGVQSDAELDGESYPADKACYMDMESLRARHPLE